MTSRKDAKFAKEDNNTGEYVAPWWLPGGHLQTIYARFLSRHLAVPYRRERWRTPDEDFIDLDWLDAPANPAKLVVLFHGLEGCSRSHYAISLMDALARRGWPGVVPHFRGCGAEANCLPRSYHAGDSEEIDWILRRLKSREPARAIHVVAISLGANMLLKWLGEKTRSGARNRCPGGRRIDAARLASRGAAARLRSGKTPLHATLSAVDAAESAGQDSARTVCRSKRAPCARARHFAPSTIFTPRRFMASKTPMNIGRARAANGG